MLNSLLILLIGALIVLFMLLSHFKDVNRDLRRQKENLQTKIIQERTKANIKEFQAYQKAKKEEIVKDIKKDNNEKRDINLSIGPHIMEF